jgi:hypothetical protein
MKTSWFVSILVVLVGGFFASPVVAQDNLVRFKGGIGVIPVSNVVVNATTGAITVNRNIVRGVQPAGQIWVISDLDATIKTNGDIKIDGRGLVLGGGSNIGTASDNSVIATLLCEDIQHSSGVVPLEPNGDFKIDDVLTPLPPNPCTNPVLLIRSSGNGNWFAAGIPELK